jgi:hypothetical protein
LGQSFRLNSCSIYIERRAVLIPLCPRRYTRILRSHVSCPQLTYTLIPDSNACFQNPLQLSARQSPILSTFSLLLTGPIPKVQCQLRNLSLDRSSWFIYHSSM